MKNRKNNKDPFHFLKVLRQQWICRGWTPVIIVAGSILALIIILVSTQFGSLFSFVRPSDFKVGKVAEKDFIVERDIIYTDSKATQLKQEAARNLVLPIFRINEDITVNVLERFDLFKKNLTALIDEKTSPDTIYFKMQLAFPGILKKEELNYILSYPMIDSLFQTARLLIEDVLKTGLISLPEQNRELFSAGAVEIWRWTDGKLEKETFQLDRVLTVNNLFSWLKARIAGYESREIIQSIQSIVASFAVENGFFDPEQTNKHRQKASEQVEPVIGKLAKNQIIIRKGDIVTEKAAEQIKAVGEYSTNVNISSISGTVLYVLIILILGLLIMNKKIKKPELKRNLIIFLAGTGLFYLFTGAVLSKVSSLPDGLPATVMLPTAAFSILITIIISTNAGFIFSLVISLLVLPIFNMDIYSFLFAVFTGIAGTAVVMNAEKRIDLIMAGFVLSVINSLFLIALNLIGNYRTGWLLPALGWGILNGFSCGMISMGFLPIFEHMLNASTRFRLRELSDLNAPVLKRMLSMAPGTYSHSISVANLAESACNEIKANSLLARVGAYYHDIGKIEQAEYFIENQRSFNKHDDLKPSLSIAVIKSHVKIGIEKAKELALPDEIVDIIAQHHGGGVIKYFYQRALENDPENNVTSEDYSYPGNRPRTREAAVVLLADTVEATSRILQKPSISKLEKHVWDIIMDKFTSNELSESDLTLKDLEVIKKSFVQILAGYFHSRIEYPKIKKATIEQG